LSKSETPLSINRWLTSWLQEHIIHGLNWPEYDADGVQEKSDFRYARVEPEASLSREPSGRGLNDRNIGVLSENNINIVSQKGV